VCSSDERRGTKKKTQVDSVLLYDSYGAFHFSQAVLPQLIESAQELNNNNNGRSSSFLCFSGATGALKGSANFAAFSPAKFALRGIAQSLAREFGEKGVHVSHVIIDGMFFSFRFFLSSESKRERVCQILMSFFSSLFLSFKV